METIQLPIKSFKQTDRLDHLIVEVAVEDVQAVIRQLGALFIKEQIDIGNPPTNILVDNSGRKAIDTAKKRIQAFFTQKDDIRLAVYAAWARVLALTRVRTGRAAASYELWFKNTPIGRSPSAVEGYIERMDPAKDFFRIVGPVLVYGRKIYWNPKGKPKLKKRTVIRGRNYVIKLVSIRGIMEQVEMAMRRKFRAVVVIEDWVVTSALPKDGRTPGLYIGFKKRGTTIKGMT